MSLQDLCMRNIADAISECPPLIQEIIIGKTKEIMKEDIKKEIQAEIKEQIQDVIKKQEKLLIKQISEDMQYIIPVITADIIRSEINGGMRVNFRNRFWDTDPYLVECAIQASENIVSNDSISANIHSKNVYTSYTDPYSDSDTESEWFREEYSDY